MKIFKDTLFTCLCLFIATVISYIFLSLTQNGSAISITYVLAIIFVSRYTNGYLYGIISSLFAVIAINYFFTYPYYAINFTLAGYPLTFIGILLISFMTGTITSHTIKQTRLANEREIMLKQLNDFNKLLLSSNDIHHTYLMTISYIEDILKVRCVIYNLDRQDFITNPSKNAFINAEVISKIKDNLIKNQFCQDETYSYFLIQDYAILIIEETQLEAFLPFLTLLIQEMELMLEKQRIQAAHQQFAIEAEKEKMRANLLRAVSHDLRTPLTNMIGASSTYIEAKDMLSQQQRDELVMSIHEDSNWLLQMVENLLSVTRIKANETKVTKSKEPVEEIVAESLEKIKKRYPTAKLKVTVPTDYLLVEMDGILIEQVLINLIENAIKHAKSKKPIDIKVLQKEDKVYFSVIDYGIGIDAKRLPTIFDTNLPMDNSKGMGIGLSICKTIIEAHDGKIEVIPHDLGTEFRFWLPMR